MNLRRLYTAQTSKRRALVVVYGSAPFAAVAFWWLQEQGTLAKTSILLLAALLLVTTALNISSFLWLRARSDSKVRLHARLAVVAITTTVIIYATGWGSLFAIGYALGLAEVVRTSGSASWRPAVLWTAAAILIAELAVEWGIAPSLVPVNLAHAIAFAGLCCVVVVTRILGLTELGAEILQDRLRHEAMHDPLTNAWNRSAFAEAVERACATARRDHTVVAALYVDVDQFKPINDTLGHAKGDEVLIEIAKRIQGSLRVGDLLGRLGGDEFGVLLVGVASPDDAVDVARRILDEVPKDPPSGFADKWPTVSIGIATSASGNPAATELLRVADEALYAAKRAGRAGWQLNATAVRPALTRPKVPTG